MGHQYTRTTYNPQPTHPYLYVKNLIHHQPSDPAAAACWSLPWGGQHLCGPTVHSEITHSGLHRNKICSTLSFCFANNIELPSGKEGSWSSSGLRYAEKAWLVAVASQMWKKTVRRPKCMQIAAQGQVEGAGLGVMKSTSLLTRGLHGQLVLNRCGQVWHTHRCRAVV